MTPDKVQYVVYAAIALIWVVAMAVTRRYARPFFGRVFITLTPVALAGVVFTAALCNYLQSGTGFRFGTDLVGGTILVYQIDEAKSQEALANDTKLASELAVRLKRRIDPNDLKNVIVRPVSNGRRVEVILPTGGTYQAAIEERNWNNLTQSVKDNPDWPQLHDADITIPQGHQEQLTTYIADKTNAKSAAQLQAIRDFIGQHYSAESNYTQNDVQEVKDKISQVGSMEFAVVANDHDDKAALEAAKKSVDAEHQDDLIRAARDGLPPPPPINPENSTRLFHSDRGDRDYSYSWVELGPEERTGLRISNDYAGTSPLWKTANENLPEWGRTFTDPQGGLLYVRSANLNTKLTDKERAEKKVEYFVLIRDTPKEYLVNGDMLKNPSAGADQQGNPIVRFGFNTVGSQHFYWLTSTNLPEDPDDRNSFHRQLAIILDGRIISAPVVNSAISDSGEIEGKFTAQQVARLVANLRAGALPATLMPQPVSENTMAATLGTSTIVKGLISIGLAFAAILIFMSVYYEFAGFVACVALLCNLLLTVSFMVLVSAAFTLPGLAGLVLMLGMAVDANVLIYERIREERDRGATLSLAIRNGYDRAFPAIIDTHLTSIFTAIVLYAVGNDQLKGFGVSLTVGLIISLFTSLYMTRLMFDLWLNRGWLRKLSMRRLFSRPNINFMAIRYYWFTATVLLTIIGLSVFLIRGTGGLNIDFVGGTAYGGRLVQAMPLDGSKDHPGLRDLLSESRQQEWLKVASVNEVPSNPGYEYVVTYQNPDGTLAPPRTIDFPQKIESKESDTPEARDRVVQQRATELPDVSVELLFPESYITGGNTSNYFTIRTREKAPDLVQAQISRLLGKYLARVYMKEPQIQAAADNTATAVTMSFTQAEAPTSPAGDAATGQVEQLLRRELKREGLNDVQVTVNGVGTPDQGRYQTLEANLSIPVDVSTVKQDLAEINSTGKPLTAKAGEQLPTEAKLANALVGMRTEFKERPVPDRLETFDQVMAGETELTALYAILLSWGAILLYLWFRFGSWTFGLAAVLCLMHDLFFTLGIIAFCHYVSVYAPGVANALALEDFKIDLTAVAALLTLVGYSVSDTIVVFDRIREVRGKNPDLTPQIINDSVNQTLSRTLLVSFATWLVVAVLYIFGGEGVHLFAFVMVVGVIVGTYSSIYIASPLLLMFGEGVRKTRATSARAVPATTNA